ncbi:MAG: hypothetical protein K1060chlam5_01150 [Candidatus Anoxychlamydiales bacterium]|nr:hypothetical protein [Candidatus Anoxychlamydiales bacterium]
MAFTIPLTTLGVGVFAFTISKISTYFGRTDSTDDLAQQIDEKARDIIFNPFGNTNLDHFEEDPKIDPNHFYEVIETNRDYFRSIIFVRQGQQSESPEGIQYIYYAIDVPKFERNKEANKEKAQQTTDLSSKERKELHLERGPKQLVETSKDEVDPSELTVSERRALHEKAQQKEKQAAAEAPTSHRRNESAFQRRLEAFKGGQAFDREILIDVLPVSKEPQDEKYFIKKHNEGKQVPFWVVACSIENALGKKIFNRLDK